MDMGGRAGGGQGMGDRDVGSWPVVRGLAVLGTSLAIGGTACAQAPAVPVYKEIKDWLVACDNTRFCEAKGFSDAESAAMRVTRSAGAIDDLAIDIDAPETGEGPDVARFSLDGRRLDLKTIQWAPVDGIGSGQITLASGDPESAYRLLRRIRDGKVLSLGSGKTAPAVPLHGLAAVLLLMDDVQGRIGNASALIQPGHAPASALPAAPRAPVLKAAPNPPPLSAADGRALAAAVRLGQRASLLKNECEADLGGATDQAEPLNASTALVMLECSRGAYQSAYLLFRASRTEVGMANLLTLPLPPGVPTVENDSFEGVVEPGYDTRKATLSVSSKGRGLGDCGTHAEWRFDGVNFAPSMYQQQNKCGGGMPGDWPTLWQAR